jgi:hypothetical protein
VVGPIHGVHRVGPVQVRLGSSRGRPSTKGEVPRHTQELVGLFHRAHRRTRKRLGQVHAQYYKSKQVQQD